MCEIEKNLDMNDCSAAPFLNRNRSFYVKSQFALTGQITSDTGMIQGKVEK